MKAPWQWYCFKTEILQIVGLNDSIHVSGGKLKALDRRRNLILDHIYIYSANKHPLWPNHITQFILETHQVSSN